MGNADAGADQTAVGRNRGGDVGHHRLEAGDELGVVALHGLQVGELTGELGEQRDLAATALIDRLGADTVPEGGSRPGDDGTHIDDDGAGLDLVVGQVAADAIDEDVIAELTVDDGSIGQTGWQADAAFDLHVTGQSADAHPADEADAVDASRIEAAGGDHQGPVFGPAAIAFQGLDLRRRQGVMLTHAQAPSRALCVSKRWYLLTRAKM
jgi:hypothetical protein